MANLTLVIDDELLRRARVRAVSEGTSVNAIAREAIQSYAGEDPAARGMADFLDAARKSTYGSGSGGRTWTRSDLYGDRVNP